MHNIIIKANNLVVIFAGIFSAMSIYLINVPLLHVIIMWLYCILVMAMAKFEITHPYVWFSAGFTLYSTGYAIVYCMGLGEYGYQTNNVLYPLLALITAVFFIGGNSYKVEDITLDETFPYRFIRICTYIFAVLLFACTISLIFQGYAGKSEMKQANDPYYRLGVYAARYLTFFALLKLCSSIQYKTTKRKEVLTIILLSVPSLLFTLYTGERDAFIRYASVMVIGLYYLRVIKKRHFLILIPLFVFVMILSVYIKYYFSSGVINTNIKGNNILYQFLRTDFMAAGRNLQYLINFPWTKGSQSYTVILTEFLYPFVPSGVFFNADRWFNYEVHTGGFKGYAFTMVGTGYIIGGLFGVLLVFTIVGLTVRRLYKRSTNGIYGLCAYIYSLTTIVFSFRESLNTIFVAIVRIVFVSLFACYLASRGIAKNNDYGKK